MATPEAVAQSKRWLASVEADILEADPKALDDTFEARPRYSTAEEGEITRGAQVKLLGAHFDSDTIYSCTGRTSEDEACPRPSHITFARLAP